MFWSVGLLSSRFGEVAFLKETMQSIGEVCIFWVEGSDDFWSLWLLLTGSFEVYLRFKL